MDNLPEPWDDPQDGGLTCTLIDSALLRNVVRDVGPGRRTIGRDVLIFEETNDAVIC